VTEKVNKEVPVFLQGQSMKEDPAFTAPRDWCRQKRAAGKGKFADHSRAFILDGPAARKAKPIETGRRFCPGNMLSSDRRIGRLEMFNV
jgi:hypothetical protein